jgi:DNA-binding NarL/FixJ family response regulator
VSSPHGDASAAAAREAVERRAWQKAFDLYAAAESRGPLDAIDLEQWATAAYLVGRVDTAIDALTKAVQHSIASGDEERAVVAMHWIIYMHIGRGDMAQVSGWMTRAQPILERLPDDSPGRGWFVALAAFLDTAVHGQSEQGMARAKNAVATARRTGDPDLLVMALNVLGRSLLRMGDAAGMEPLDEAMVVIVGGTVSPIPAGTVYCSVIEACEEIADVRRAQEWTEALDAWCSRQGDMVTFTGRCLIHRSSLLSQRGEWQAAVAEARRACDRLAGAADEVSSGRAHYQLGELARMTRNHEDAESEYQEAARWGHDPQPGLALLRLAQGNVSAAAAMMRRLDAEHGSVHERTGFLPAFVRIMVEAGDRESARSAASELAGIAETLGTDCLRAEAEYAMGLVAVADGDHTKAITALRRSASTWRRVGAPFEVAQVQLSIARACRDLGDSDTAEFEEEAARRTLDSLGVADPTRSDPDDMHGLSRRELEVLQLLATGITNQDVADRLFVSVRTVDRHVANIFTKLGVTSRTAATAFAYEHDLV